MVTWHFKSQSLLTHSVPLFSLSVDHYVYHFPPVPQVTKIRQTYFLAKYKYYLQMFTLFVNVV